MLIEHIVVLITGFAQPRNISNGMQALAKRLHAAGQAASFPVATRVHQATWRVDVRALVRSTLTLDGIPELTIAGHSYGGWAAHRIAWEFQKAGRPVNNLLLTDAVDKRDEGVKNDKLLIVPKNVERLWSWRQQKRRPRGSTVRLESSHTEWVVNEIVEGVKHARMDELPAFQEAVFNLVARGQ